jgi:large subunit ribosomal protein L6
VSRIGKNPIAIEKGVEAKLNGSVVSFKGPKGSMTLDTKGHVNVKQEDGALHVERHSDDRQDRAYHGLYQRLLRNMAIGVATGFTRQLELTGVGYRAAMKGKTLVLGLGYSHDIEFTPPEGITITTPIQTQVLISGVDKQQVGQIAANIRSYRPPEPYKGKGIRYSDERIRRKVGKTGGK